MVRTRSVGIALMIAATATWASGTLLTKVAVERTTLPAPAVLTVQLTASVTLLTIIAAIRRQLPRRAAGAWRHGLSGLLEPALSYQFFVAGLAFTSAGHASIIGAAEPVLVPFGAWLVYRQRPANALFVLMSVAAGGTVLLVGGATGRGSIKGDLLVLAGTGCAAMYVVVSSRSIVSMAPLTLAIVQQVVALVTTLIIAAAVVIASGNLGHDRAPTLLLIALSGIVMTALPFPLYLTALTHLDAAVAAQYIALIPLFGFGGSLVFLGETITLSQAIGAVVILAALVLVARLGPAGAVSTGSASNADVTNTDGAIAMAGTASPLC
jgi:drug/metabolite transporter (DMT)-like permease